MKPSLNNSCRSVGTRAVVGGGAVAAAVATGAIKLSFVFASYVVVVVVVVVVLVVSFQTHSCFSSFSSSRKIAFLVSRGINRISELYRIRLPPTPTLSVSILLGILRFVVRSSPHLPRNIAFVPRHVPRREKSHSTLTSRSPRAPWLFHIYGMLDNHIIFRHSSSMPERKRERGGFSYPPLPLLIFSLRFHHRVARTTSVLNSASSGRLIEIRESNGNRTFQFISRPCGRI